MQAEVGSGKADVQFFTTGLDIQVSSQTFTHLLRALGLIHSTTQKKRKLAGVSDIPSVLVGEVCGMRAGLVQGSVIGFRNAFPLQVSLLCVPGTAAGCKELYSLWDWQFPTCSTDSHSLCLKGQQASKPKGVPQMLGEWMEQ
jgi:hypothetical protein